MLCKNSHNSFSCFNFIQVVLLATLFLLPTFSGLAEGSTCTETPDGKSIEEEILKGIDWTWGWGVAKPEKGSSLYNQVVGYLCAGISLDAIQVEEVKGSYIEGDEGNSNFCLKEAQDSNGAQGQCHLTCKNSGGKWVSGDACKREGSSDHEYSFVVVHPPPGETGAGGVAKRACFIGEDSANACTKVAGYYTEGGLLSGVEDQCQPSSHAGTFSSFGTQSIPGHCFNYKKEQKVEDPFVVGRGEERFLNKDDCETFMIDNYSDAELSGRDLCLSEILKGSDAYRQTRKYFSEEEFINLTGQGHFGHPCLNDSGGEECKAFEVTHYFSNDKGLKGLNKSEREAKSEGRLGTGFECGSTSYTYGNTSNYNNSLEVESLRECLKLADEKYGLTGDSTGRNCIPCLAGSSPKCETARVGQGAQICFDAEGLPGIKAHFDRISAEADAERAEAAIKAREDTWAGIYKPGQLVPCYGLGDPDKKDDKGIRAHCDWNALIQLANNVISFAIRLAAVILVIVILIAGWGLITSQGNPQALTNARAKLFKAILGFAIVVCAWLIVNTVMNTLLAEEFQDDDIINLLEDGTS